MLQLANLDSVSQQLEPTQMDLADVLRWVAKQSESIAQQRKITVTVEAQSASVTGIEDHLRMLFQNLVTNAIIYSHEGGRVTVGCTTEANGVTAWVSDDGIGIAQEKLPRIFEEHYRTKEAAEHNRQSSGLGLAIVRQVARQHNIGVRVHSRQQHGTRFEVEFPPAA